MKYYNKLMVVAQNIKHYRKQAGLTQDQFAVKVGIHYQSVSRWERGLCLPDIALFDVIAKVLGVTIEDLFGYPSENTVVGEGFSSEKMGSALKQLRVASGLSQKAFGLKFDCTSDAVSKWERGLIAPPIETLVAIATHFDVALSALYYGNLFSPRQENNDGKIVVPSPKSKKIKWYGIGACAVLVIMAIVLLVVFLPPKPVPRESGFLSPIENGVLKHTHGFFHDEELNQYHEHDGVCILADVGTNVVASFSGTVTEINVDDILVGPYIVVEDQNRKAVYHFINATEGLKVGDDVAIGQIIGTVCDAVGDEYYIGPHIKFQLFQTSEYADDVAFDPEKYITFVK